MLFKNTRIISLLPSALMALLLSGSMMIQFPMALGEKAHITMSTVSLTSKGFPSSSRHRAIAFANPWNDDQKQQRERTRTRSFSAAPVFAARESSTSFAESSENQQSSGTIPSRRHFLGSLATSAVASQLAAVPLAFAVESNSTDTVDWDSFGAQLQKSQFSPSSGPAAFPVNGGSDLDKALQDSSKRKTIDPRTHG